MNGYESELMKQRFKTLDAFWGHVWELSRYDESDADMPSSEDMERLRSVLWQFYRDYDMAKCHVLRSIL